MHIRTSGFLVFTILLASCSNTDSRISNKSVCDDAWYETLELHFHTGDVHGHGPDIGSSEWKSVIEFKLGLAENASVPDQNSSAWCSYVEELIDRRNS